MVVGIRYMVNREELSSTGEVGITCRVCFICLQANCLTQRGEDKLPMGSCLSDVVLKSGTRQIDDV